MNEQNDERLADAVVATVAKCLEARERGLTPLCDTCKQAFLGDTPEAVLVAALSHYGLLRTSFEIEIRREKSPSRNTEGPSFTLPFDPHNIQ